MLFRHCARHCWSSKLLKHIRSCPLIGGCCCAESLQWETPLQIIQYPDPRLRADNATITTFDRRLEAFAADMFETMYNG